MLRSTILALIALAALLAAPFQRSLVGGSALTPADPGDAVRGVAGDDAWDDRFDTPGLSGAINTVAVAADGSIYVGGLFWGMGGSDASNIARWDGRRWHSLGSGVDGEVFQIAIDGDDVYAVGRFAMAGAVNANQIARWDGAIWQPVGSGEGPDSSGNVNAVAVKDGDVYVGGRFEAIDGVPAVAIAAWNGVSWSSLGHGLGSINFDGDGLDPYGEVRTILLDGNDVIAGGRFEAAGYGTTFLTVNNIARWRNNAWQALGQGMSDTNDPYAASVETLLRIGNKLYAGGTFNRADNKVANNIAAWDGQAWGALGSGLANDSFAYRTVRSLANRNGLLVAAGNFVGAGGVASHGLAQWNGSAWTNLGGPEDGVANAVAVDGGGRLVVGGGFTRIGDSLLNNIGLLDNGVWASLGQGLSYYDTYRAGGRSTAVAVAPDGVVFAGGEFAYAGSTASKNVARWDGEAWRTIGNVSGFVETVAVGGNDVFVGGTFTQAGGVSASNIAAWNRTTGQWRSLGGGTNGVVYALVYKDGILYVGGSFTSAGGTAAEDVAWWDGSQWHAFGDQFRIWEPGSGGGEYPTHVYALDVQGDLVVVGGQFQTLQALANGSLVLVNNVVMWNRATDTWYRVGRQTPTEEPGVTINGATGFLIQANAVRFAGNEVFVGGSFNQAGAIAASHIAAWNLNSGVWSNLNGGVGIQQGDPDVHALFLAGNRLYVGGEFTSAGPTAAQHVAIYNLGSRQWQTLGSGLGGVPSRALVATGGLDFAVSGNHLYVAGEFRQAGGKPSYGFAHYDMSPLPAGPYRAFLPAVVR